MTEVEFAKQLKKDLKTFDKNFNKIISSDIKILQYITKLIIRYNRNKTRPLFVILSSKLANNSTEMTYTAATLVELLHTATYIHKKIKEENKRNIFSFNVPWKEKIGILMGDYLLAKGLSISVKFKSYELLQAISEATKQMSESELLIHRYKQQSDFTSSLYLSILNLKAGKEIGSCTYAGALAATSSQENQQKIKLFGENLGVALELKKELLSLQKSMKKRFTITPDPIIELNYPIVYTYEKAEPEEKEIILKFTFNTDKVSTTFKSIIPLMEKYQAIYHTKKKIEEYKNLSIEQLQVFQNSVSKNYLISYVNKILTIN